MITHNFTIIASGPEMQADELANRVYEAGGSDATVSTQKGVIVLEFDREARTFISALLSACENVIRAGLKIERIEPDHLVSASEIADRSGLGRAAISLYASGERGSGFPHPIVRVTTESPLWDWVEVATWMHHQHKVSLTEVVRAKLVRELNRVLIQDELHESRFSRRIRPRLKRENDWALA